MSSKTITSSTTTVESLLPAGTKTFETNIDNDGGNFVSTDYCIFVKIFDKREHLEYLKGISNGYVEEDNSKNEGEEDATTNVPKVWENENNVEDGDG